MKKLISATLLFLSCTTANAALIFTDEAEFLSKYHNPLGSINFGTATPLRGPAWSVVLTDYYQGESWADGIVFETRNSGFGYTQAVAKHRNGSEIRAVSDIPGGRITVQLYRPQHIVALYTSVGFFGWVPELNTNLTEDGLFWLPEGATISGFDYGYTAKPPVVEASEPGTIALFIAGLFAIAARVKRFALPQAEA